MQALMAVEVSMSYTLPPASKLKCVLEEQYGCNTLTTYEHTYQDLLQPVNQLSITSSLEM